MQDIPEILNGKIFEERFYPDIFDIYKDQRYAVQELYQKGSSRLRLIAWLKGEQSTLTVW